mmetsp:Transcript_93915/g.180569  ORF Transcript_93915/g.180569 Transcript_93915/m.180569 type:complete len:465 (-) Transcript_93915:65-1459(-)
MPLDPWSEPEANPADGPSGRVDFPVPKVMPRPSAPNRFSGAPEPEKRNALQKIVFSTTFEMISGLLILVNTLIMALQLQYDGFDAGNLLRVHLYRSSKSTWPGADDFFHVADITFNCVFLLELLLRYAAMGPRAALRNPWMWFDSFIVGLGLADFIANQISDGGLGMDPTMIRVARLIRLVRMLKVFKTMNAFDSLFLLIKAIHASFHALLWSFLLLVTVQITMGMFMCQLLGTYIMDDSDPSEEKKKQRTEVFIYFGTFTRTMLTMFEITLGNWVPSCRTLMEYVSEWYMLFYIVYRCMFCFAVLKVIAAVFITETNRVLQNDDELTILKTRREKAGYLRKLGHLFQQMDAGQDGELDFEDLQALMTDDYMVTWLATLGFEGHDFEKIFKQASHGDGNKLNMSTFLDSVVKAKGGAKTIDIFGMIHMLEQLDDRISTLDSHLRRSQEQNMRSFAVLNSRVVAH